jgi:multiple sugar transport system substrate-binding protein
MIDNFNAANSDLQIRMETLPYEEYDTKVLAAVSAGAAPDFGWAAPAGGLEADWIAKGVIVPLDDLVTAVGLDLNDFTDAALKVARYPTFGNKLYEIPMDVMTMAVEINVDHVKEAGLDINNPPKTGDELIEWAKAMTKYEGGKVVRSGFLMGPSIQNCVTWGIVSAQMGFQRASDDLKVACVNPEAGKKAMQWVLDLFDKHKVSTREVTDRYKAFGTGEGSMFLTGPWTISGYMKQGLNFISIHVPKIGEEQKTYLEVGTLEVYKQKDASRNEAAVRAIKWLSDNSLLWTTKGRGAAVRKSILALPAYKTEGLPWEMRGAFVDDKALAMATVPIGLQVVKGADDFVIYSGDNFLATTLDRVWHGEKSIDEAMDALCKKWQEYLAEG